MKQQKNDRLKSLFQEVELTDLSFGFDSRLMRRINHEAEKKVKLNQLYNILWLAVGVFAIVTIVILASTYMNVSFDLSWLKTEKIEFKNIFMSVNFNSSIIGLAGLILALLLGDTLIRKKIEGRNTKK